MTAIVHIDDLYELDACPQQRGLFRRLFGPSAVLNAHNLRLARKRGLDTPWLLRNTDRADVIEAAYSLGDELHHLAIATNANTPPHILAELAITPIKEQELRVANNPSTPTATLKALIRTGHAAAVEVAINNLARRQSD